MGSESVTNLELTIQRARRNTLGDLLMRSVARFPEKRAFTYKNRHVTYEQLNELVNKTANGLKARGVKQGDRLAILSKNNLDFVVVTFALAKMGVVLIPISYMMKGNDIT